MCSMSLSLNTKEADNPSKLWALAIGAVGVVYGDIGTSPLYAFREAVSYVARDGTVERAEVLGILSLILWALTIIVTIKYVSILLKIDNRGEGGTLALMALARSVIYRNTTIFLFLGIVGAALFYGDAMITPAISVLSAVEGLKIITPAFEPYIMPIALAVIILLFYIQDKGTAKVSVFFGPITVVWFLVLAVTGLLHIMEDPAVLMALNPYYAFHFIATHTGLAFVTLGAVFLAVTGAEALYADLGHFGKRPIQLAWGWLVFPSLSLNYLGQGALVLGTPEALDNPFFRMVDQSLLLPMVILATIATIIASQAVITGAFSLTRQAVNLGLLPRMVIRQTSDQHLGQIYMPQVNYLLMVGVIILVVLFKSSSALAAAYGISVTGTMVVTAIMVFFVVWQIWEWPLWAAALLVGPFFAIDAIFLGANLIKIADGGWVPLLIAATITSIMLTWIKGTFIISGRARKRDVKIEKFIREYREKFPGITRVPGSAFFLTSDQNLMPSSLLQNIRHNKILHARNIIMSIRIEPIPHVETEERALITHLDENFSLVVLRFGFKDQLDVQAELIKLNRTRNNGIDFDWRDTSLFLSRRQIRSHHKYGMPRWQDWIYILLHKHSSEPADFYKLPVGRVIEIGRHVII